MAEQATSGLAGLLRQLRAEAQLTQQELAKAAGLSPRAVSDLERGIHRTARQDTAVRLAGALGLAEPIRSLFVAAALGRIEAAQVLAARRAQPPGEPLISAGGMHGFVPALTSFVGRAGPVREVAALLDRSRLVTVTGPGGAGKTRLAGQVARQVAGRFADGTWLAELAPVRDPALVPAIVAAALGIPERPGVSAAEALARVLARQQLLLVLDNCEHVIDAAAGLCGGLLAACDDVRVLATSREPLRVAGEAGYRLEPLALPGPDDADAAGSEAVALFAERARQADAHFALTGETTAVVARLVRRLDGMPLAIELAAARVESLGVTQLLDRIDDRFALLVAGDRLAARRQRSLAATVEWSYQLLDESERRVFRQVSVFQGPFTLEGAEAVAGKDAGPAVARLVDCSLLVPPGIGPDDRSRYGMLETLRAYGGRLLAEAGELEETATALAGYALRVAEQAAAGLETTTTEVAAARWLDAEDAMMRQALAWGMDHDTSAALQLAVALAPWWLLRGRLVGQYTLLREAAAGAEAGSDGWSTAQYWLGYTALYSADLAGALGHFTAVRDASWDRGPSRALADALSGRSLTLAILGRIAEAVEDGRRSLALSREFGYPAGEVRALVRLAVAARYAGDLDSTMRLALQAGQVTAEIPGWLDRLRSIVLTEVMTEAGDPASAEPVCAASLARSRDAGDLWSEAELLIRVVVLDLQAGRTGDAAAHLRQALQLTARTGGRISVLDNLDCCGHLCAATRHCDEAITVWAAYAALSRHEVRYTEPPTAALRRHEPLRKARQALGPARTRAAEERGAVMSLATAAEYALMLTDPGPPQPTAPASRQLSARERELVTLVAQGRTNAQIAAQLYISARTVGSHLDRIRDKTGYRRRADLTRLALSEGLV
jgi:predicted ATPase/DNA-binding CsgD family transcriptional regulator/transcriptional regulator with XRE-family HTH domain